MEKIRPPNLFLIVLVFLNICSATIYEEQNNPDVWPGLCQVGKKQSPINLVEKQAKTKLYRLRFTLQDYDKSLAKIKLNNDGKTILATLPNPNIRPSLKFNNTKYELIQFHFHWTGSEHAINGVLYDGEIHLVHQDPTNKTNLLVLGALLKKSFYSNNAISNIFRHSLETISNYNQTTYFRLRSNLRKLLDQISLNKFLTYEGSLTTPDCDEPVKWIVLREFIKVDKKAIENLGKHFKNKNGEVLKFNYRKIKTLNDRQVSKSYLWAFQMNYGYEF